KLTAGVGDHVEAGAVDGPWAGHEHRLVVVRRELTRFPGLEVDQVNRRVAVVPEVERQQLRPVWRETPWEREHALAEHRARLATRGVTNPDLHVGGVARIRRVSEPRPVGRPRGATDVVLNLRLVCQLVGPAVFGFE